MFYQSFLPHAIIFLLLLRDSTFLWNYIKLHKRHIGPSYRYMRKVYKGFAATLREKSGSILVLPFSIFLSFLDDDKAI